MSDCIVHGILQARTLEWVAFPFPRGSSQSRDQTQVSHIAGRFFTSWATREALLVALVVKSPPANAGHTRDASLISGLGRSSGVRNGSPLQYSCLQNPMDRGAWWATLPGVEKNQTWLSMEECFQRGVEAMKKKKLCKTTVIKNWRSWTSLAVQRLRHCFSSAGYTGSIPGWGTKIPHAVAKKERIGGQACSLNWRHQGGHLWGYAAKD